MQKLASAPDKASGPDGISSALLRTAPHQAAELLHPLYTKVGLRRREPLGFKGGTLCTIPKGGDESYTTKAWRDSPGRSF